MEAILQAIFFFVLGSIIGSFLNVVVLRYPLKFSARGRSICFSCGEKLSWKELIPVLSYFLLKGTCKHCKSRISPQYPLVEAGTGLLFMGLFLKGYTGLSFVLPAVVVALLFAIAVYDIKHKIIPDGLVYSFIGIALLKLFIDTDTLSLVVPSIETLAAGPLLFLPFFALWFFSKGTWMGLGDGKLALGMGWFLGLVPGISAIVLAFWVGAVVSLLLIGFQKLHIRLPFVGGKLSMKAEVPFAPFLILGFFAVLYVEFSLRAFIL